VVGSKSPTVIAAAAVAVKAMLPVAATGNALPATTVWVVAVTVAAPEDFDGYSVTVATPDASVTAAALSGEKVPILASVLKVTTAPATADPLASLNVALTFAGLPGTTVVVGALVVASVKARVNVGGGAVVPVPVPVPVPPPAGTEPPVPDPPHPLNIAKSANIMNRARARMLVPRALRKSNPKPERNVFATAYPSLFDGFI
jgi:hypothetical protein